MLAAFYGNFRRIDHLQLYQSKMVRDCKTYYLYDDTFRLAKILTGFVLMMAMTQAALAVDWQYCLAPSHSEHKVYMSEIFLQREGLGSADSAFEKVLNQIGLHYDDIQCPRADDERSIVIMRQYAIRLNQEQGSKVIQLPLERRK